MAADYFGDSSFIFKVLSSFWH